MASIAPWLRATDTLGAAEAGVRTGTTLRGQNIEAGENAARVGVEQQGIAQRAAEVGARMQFAQQQLSAKQQEQQQRSQMVQEKMKQDFDLQTTREAVQNQYQQQRLELQKQQVKQQGTKEVQRLSDLKGYQDGIAAGGKPVELAQKFPNAFSSAMWGDILRPTKSAQKSTAEIATEKGAGKALQTLHEQLIQQQGMLSTKRDADGKELNDTQLDSARQTAGDLALKISNVEKNLKNAANQPAPVPAAATPVPGAAVPTATPAATATPPAAPAAPKRVPPPAAIQALQKDPSKKDQFDAYYGPGSADAILKTDQQ